MTSQKTQAQSSSLRVKSHLVFDKSQQKFVRVEDYSKAKIDTTISSDYFTCLITSKNKILIGNELFWDWEDHFVKN
jgi:hypothetical protein